MIDAAHPQPRSLRLTTALAAALLSGVALAGAALAQPGGVRGDADRAFGELDAESKRAAEERLPPPVAPKPRPRPALVVQPAGAVGVGPNTRSPPPVKRVVDPPPAEPEAAAAVVAAPEVAAPAADAATIGPDDPRMDQPVNLAHPDNAVMDAAIRFATNAERVRHGLKPVDAHPALARASAAYAERMARLNFFDHQDPHDAAHRAPGDRAKAAGIATPYIAENIAQSHATTDQGRPFTHRVLAQGVVTQWMNSPGHRANILSADGLQTGAGVAGHPNGRQVMAVQMFQWFERAP